MTISDNDMKTITDILNEELAIKKRLKEISNIKAFYQDELRELASVMHQTRDGTIMLVSQMKDDHLINTVRMYIAPDMDLQGVPNKYLKEVRVRGLIQKVLEIRPHLASRDQSMDDDEDVDMGDAELY